MTITTAAGRSASPSMLVHLLGRSMAVVLGVAGLAFGIGVGVRRAVLGMITWEAAVGLASLVGGLVLCVWGVCRVTSGMRSVPRVMTATLLVGAAAVVLWTATPAVIATQVPPPAGPAADLGLGGGAVSFDTADGVRLWGWYIPPPNGRVVILRHGAGSTSADVTPQAAVLVANEYGVLMTDARGHGGSEGTAMDFGWYGNSDIAAAVDFLAQQPEVDARRIAVVGMSMGGEEAIGALATEHRIRAVVAEGATARTDADKVWLEEEYGWRGWVQVRLEWLQYTLADLLTEATRPESLALSAQSASSRPILLITASKMADEGHAARFIGTGLDNVSIWQVPNAGHIQGVTSAPQDWENRVVRFLDDALDADG